MAARTVTLLRLAARSGTTTSDPVETLEDGEALVLVSVTASSNPANTTTVTLEGSWDGGTWVSLGVLPAITDTGTLIADSERGDFQRPPPFMRAVSVGPVGPATTTVEVLAKLRG